LEFEKFCKKGLIEGLLLLLLWENDNKFNGGIDVLFDDTMLGDGINVLGGVGEGGALIGICGEGKL